MAVLSLLLAALGGMPMWLILAKWMGKFWAWQTFNIVNAITNILLIIPRKVGPLDSHVVTHPFEM